MTQTAAAVPAPSESQAGFRALMRNRNYALLWTGQLVSEMGNRFHWIAISLWIYSLTHSAAAVSIAVASMFGGSLFASIWAGAIADRFVDLPPIQRGPQILGRRQAGYYPATSWIISCSIARER